MFHAYFFFYFQSACVIISGVKFLIASIWLVHFENPFWSSVLIGVFKTFTFNVITDILKLKSIVFFVVVVFYLSVFSVSVLVFLPSCGLLEQFLEFYFIYGGV